MPKHFNKFIKKGELHMFDLYPDILTIHDVSEALMIGRGRVYKLLNKNELKGFRIGDTWKISKESLIDYVRSNTTSQNQVPKQ